MLPVVDAKVQTGGVQLGHYLRNSALTDPEQDEDSQNAIIGQTPVLIGLDIDKKRQNERPSRRNPDEELEHAIRAKPLVQPTIELYVVISGRHCNSMNRISTHRYLQKGHHDGPDHQDDRGLRRK